MLKLAGKRELLFLFIQADAHVQKLSPLPLIINPLPLYNLNSPSSPKVFFFGLLVQLPLLTDLYSRHVPVSRHWRGLTFVELFSVHRRPLLSVATPPPVPPFRVSPRLFR